MCSVTKEILGKEYMYVVDLHIALIKQFYAHDVNHVSEVLHSQQMK
jgi:hypothetical protein